MSIQSMLIDAGVKNLREFGYPDCNAENILTDEIYRGFFASMLDDNKGHGVEIDKAIDALLTTVRPTKDAPDLGESSASDSESKPAPKRVI